MWIKAPFRNGSVFDALIFTRMHEGVDGESTAMSWTPKWLDGEKLARLGTVNSEARRKPKYPREQAAQNIRWSGRRRSRDRQITNIKSSVIGKREEDEEPWERLIPRITLWRRRQLARGSGNPCSMWSALIPERYTLMEECWILAARKVANKHKVHSSAGQGEPEEWSLPSWVQNDINCAWADAYERRVEGASPSVRKE